eukprot:m.188062 g.188062  ORF g.188062 m.188062 type:complete len:256 (-) comp10021_c2_seq2:1073-1840(-)
MRNGSVLDLGAAVSALRAADPPLPLAIHVFFQCPDAFESFTTFINALSCRVDHLELTGRCPGSMYYFDFSAGTCSDCVRCSRCDPGALSTGLPYHADSCHQRDGVLCVQGFFDTSMESIEDLASALPRFASLAAALAAGLGPETTSLAFCWRESFHSFCYDEEIRVITALMDSFFPLLPRLPSLRTLDLSNMTHIPTAQFQLLLASLRSCTGLCDFVLHSKEGYAITSVHMAEILLALEESASPLRSVALRLPTF